MLRLQKDFLFPTANTAITIVRMSGKNRVLSVLNDFGQLGRENTPKPSVGNGTPQKHTSTLTLVKFYPLRFSQLMRSHLGMKGTLNAPGELLSTCASS